MDQLSSWLLIMADRVVRLRDGQILKNYLNDKKVKAEDLEW